MQRNYYSFVFRPSPEVAAHVVQMREKLGDAGKNDGGSDACIGIVEFEANESELNHFLEYAAGFVSNLISQSVEFTSFDAVSPSPGRDNGVLYFTTSKNSLPVLKTIMDSFYAGFPMKGQIWAYVSHKPYITLARELSKNRLLTAKNLFSGARSARTKFDCDSITLRQYDQATQQFHVIQDFVFGTEVSIVSRETETSRKQ